MRYSKVKRKILEPNLQSLTKLIYFILFFSSVWGVIPKRGNHTFKIPGGPTLGTAVTVDTH